jgi:ABC-type phosphate/phosphonate transport system substrate-binding protein
MVDKIPLSIAFIVDQETFGTQNDPSYMAEIFSDETIFDVTPYPVESEEAMIESLRFGHVDLAMMDAASSWMSWKNYGLQVLLADQENYGRTYYNSNAWVKSDSEIATYHNDDDPLTDPFSLFEGKKSCHTGWFDSVGMLLPMGFLLGLGYANVAGNPNDVESLLFTIQEFLDDEPPIPEAGTRYYGYSGALRCLSDGTGDIAFLQDSTVADHCSEEDQNRPSWCLPEDDYTVLPTFGRSPSNALMFNPEFLDSETSQKISEEFLRLSGINEMDQTLRSLFGTSGFASTNSFEHLDGYSSLIFNIPGMQAYFEDPSNTEYVNLSVEEVVIGVIGPLSNSTAISLGFFADSISDDVGIGVSISEFGNQNSLIENLSNGNINIAITDGISSWKAWKHDGMSVLTSLLNEQESAFSQSLAIVKSDGQLANSSEPYSLMRGLSPCFSGKSHPSTLLVTGHLVGAGLTNDLQDIENSTISEIIQSAFNSNYSFPEEESEFYGTNGALRCLSEGGGDIAFVISDEQEVFCHDDSQPSDETWCLDPEDHALLTSIGALPYRSFIYDPTILDVVSRTAILNSILSLNSEMFLDNFTTMGSEYTGCYDISIHKIDETSPRGACGSEILSNSLHSTGVSRATSQSQLGHLSTMIGNLPEQLLFDYLVEN